MKHLLIGALAAIGLAACEGEAPADAADASASDRYDLEIVASGEGETLNLVQNLDSGDMAALMTVKDQPDEARLLEGRAAESALEDALADAANDLPEPGEPQIKLFGLEIYGDLDGEGDDSRVRIRANIGDGPRVMIDASGEDENGAAHIVIGGVGRRAAANFIDEIENAPRDLKDEMKQSLGLD